MKLTITDDPAFLEKRIAALRKLKQSAVKAGLPEKAGGGSVSSSPCRSTDLP